MYPMPHSPSAAVLLLVDEALLVVILVRVATEQACFQVRLAWRREPEGNAASGE